MNILKKKPLKTKKGFLKHLKLLSSLIALGFVFSTAILAQNIPVNIDLEALRKPLEFSSSIGLLISMGSISLVPFFLMSTTSFLRFIIVLGMIRNALQTNTSPPNPVIISLALFLTVYTMSPVYQNIYKKGIEPYNNNQITQQRMLDIGLNEIKGYMLQFANQKDITLFVEFAKDEPPENLNDLSIFVIVPAFIISELKTAFQIGFLLFIPFVVIDLVISNILLSLGMFMLSPVMVSLPFKILLFVLADGWHLIVRGLLQGTQIQ